MSESKKLIDGWGANDDEQVLWLGLPVALLLLAGPLLLGMLGDDEDIEDVLSPAAQVEEEEDSEQEPEASEADEVEVAEEATPETDANGFLAVAPTYAELPGDINHERNENEVTLTGFVASQEEKDQAEASVLELEDVESVNNELIVLQTEVLNTLDDAGVVNAETSGAGTEIVVRGSVGSQEEKAAVVEAAEQVPGVTRVIDEIEVNALDVANSLPQVEFATGSSTILSSSFDNLRQAGELIAGSDLEAIEVQGYTDTAGDENANLTLSQNRADAVRNFLIGEGVDAGVLSAVGYGETTQFAEGDSPEALAENRKVQFAAPES